MPVPDFLRNIAPADEVFPAFETLVTRTVLAVLLGFVVAGVYRFHLGRRTDTRTLPTTLVMLTLLTALVTVVIGNNTARAFGLVGALSIVRFRTVVEDTRDTAFVIFAVVVGMAAGAGYVELALASVPAVLSIAVVMRGFDRLGAATPWRPETLVVKLAAGIDPDGLLAPLFGKYLAGPVRLTGVETAKQGTSLELKYAVTLRDPKALIAFVGDLNRTDGVQNVELR